MGDNRHLRQLQPPIDYARLGEEGFIVRTVGERLVITKLAKRTVKVTKIHNEECKRLLRLLGVPVVTVNLTGRGDRFPFAADGGARGVYRFEDILPALREVVATPGSVMPSERLANEIARRRAARYLALAEELF